MKTVTMVVAALMPELGIGFKGKLPWRLKNEMANFKNITTTADSNKRNIVIMGRKTWESIPPKFRPLPDRLNIVLTRNPPTANSSPADKNLMYLNDIDKLFSLLKDDTFIQDIDKVFLIGGSELYNRFSHHESVTHIILTELVSSKPVEIDTYLDWDLSKWTQKSHSQLESFTNIKLDEQYHEKDFEYSYKLYEKK